MFQITFSTLIANADIQVVLMKLIFVVAKFEILGIHARVFASYVAKTHVKIDAKVLSISPNHRTGMRDRNSPSESG